MNIGKFFSLTVMSIAFAVQAHSSVTSAAYSMPVNRNERITPGKNELLLQQLRWFATVSIHDYEKIRGKKLNFFERMAFRLNQHRAKQLLKRDYDDVITVFQKISWCFKGLILGPIALLLGYIFLRDEQRELLKWIWFGFAGWCIIVALILLTI